LPRKKLEFLALLGLVLGGKGVVHHLFEIFNGELLLGRALVDVAAGRLDFLLGEATGIGLGRWGTRL